MDVSIKPLYKTNILSSSKIKISHDVTFKSVKATYYILNKVEGKGITYYSRNMNKTYAKLGKFYQGHLFGRSTINQLSITNKISVALFHDRSF